MSEVKRWIVPMRGRNPDEHNRASTPLELFFDLVIVVAIAVAASSLHHGIAEDHILDAVLGYFLTFFAIWWAWMGFTWFAAGYDTDDVPYRIAVFVQMAGAIIMAAGITIMQILWILAFLLLPGDVFAVAFLVLVAGELAVPILAGRGSGGVWHAEHIAERYGLLTIIVLGESVLAGATAFSSVADDAFSDPELLFLAVGALLLVFAMWWLYFERKSDDLLNSRARAFEWGYGHYFIWAAAAAVGAGIAVGVDVLTHHAVVDMAVAGAAVAIPVAIYLAGIWVLHDVPRPMSRLRMLMSPIAVVLVLLTPLTPQPIFLTGAVVVGLLAVRIATTPQAET